jgi:diadenylate cyclase
MQIIYFFAFLLILTYLCKALNLFTVYWFVTTAQLPIFVGLVILYAPELRRAVSDLTNRPFFRRVRKKENPTIAEVAKAAQVLSRRHIGALIVFERSTNLQGFIDTGIPMDSQVSSELLISIFSPLTPLHDGAVIIRETRVAAAACLLPLSQRDEIDSSMGMRHRAALGLAEETDAITVVVSEETGAISVALNGRFTRELEPPRFQHILGKLMQGGGK